MVGGGAGTVAPTPLGGSMVGSSPMPVPTGAGVGVGLAQVTPRPGNMFDAVRDREGRSVHVRCPSNTVIKTKLLTYYFLPDLMIELSSWLRFRLVSFF